MKINAQHQRFMLILALMLATFWMGRLSIQYEMVRQLPAVQAIDEINPTIPLVEITSIENAQLSGRVNQDHVRITSGEQVAVAQDDLSFTLDIQHLGYLGPKRPVIEHVVPEWAQFVASKKGKYYYEIDEKQAKRLSVPNRLYFESEEEAEGAGYNKRRRGS